MADFLLQAFGFAAYAIPILILALGWNWVRSSPIRAPWAKVVGSVMLVGATCAAFGFGTNWHPIANSLPAGGVVGVILADDLMASMNLTGAAMFTAVCWILGLYLVSTFEMSKLAPWFRVPASLFSGVFSGVFGGMFGGMGGRLRKWREERGRIAKERAERRALKRALAAKEAATYTAADAARDRAEAAQRWGMEPAHAPGQPSINDPLRPPFVPQVLDREEAPRGPSMEEIPIRTLEELPPEPAPFELTRPEPVDISRSRAPKLIHRPSRASSARRSSCRPPVCCRSRPSAPLSTAWN